MLGIASTRAGGVEKLVEDQTFEKPQVAQSSSLKTPHSVNTPKEAVLGYHEISTQTMAPKKLWLHEIPF
jgi:hypothetical protein